MDLAHEVTEHRSSRASASHTALAPQIAHGDDLERIADPDRCGVVRRVAHEPGIAEVLGSTGLASRGLAVVELGPGCGAGSDVGFEGVSDPGRRVSRHDALASGHVLVQHVAVAIFDPFDVVGLHAHAAVGEHRIPNGLLQGRDLLGAQRH